MIEHIRSIDLFSGLPEDKLEKLAGIAATENIDRGEEIFQEGETAAGFYAVLDGRVKIYKVSFAGKEQILHVLGPGEVFAEVAVFAGKKYPAAASALEKTKLLFLPRNEFRTLIGKDPDMAMHMLALLSIRLRKFTKQVESLSLMEVPGRLAAHLLLLKGGSEKDAVTLDLPKGQLASLLGTIPETLSRVIRKMTEQEIIEVNGKQVTLLDQYTLQELASGQIRLT